LYRPTIFMTTCAVRSVMESTVMMTVFTIKITVSVIQLKTGDRMDKVTCLPVRVASITVSLIPDNALAGDVAFAAIKIGVIDSESPIIGVMSKGLSFCGTVALVAVVVSVTTYTEGVDFLVSLFCGHCQTSIMTISTFVAEMAVLAVKAESS
jgi:hypothetical protein